MLTRIALLLAALLAVLALVATPAPVRAESALMEAEAEAEAGAEDEVDDTAESEMLDEVEGEEEDEGEDELDAEDEDAAEDEAEAEAEDEAEAEFEVAEDTAGVVEAEDVSVSAAEMLETEVVPGHALSGSKCPKADVCPACPGVSAVAAERETRAAAKAYMHEFGDSDAVADMTVRDTVRPAFMAGVQFADESVRKAAKAARTSYRHAVELMDAHRHYRQVPKGCPKLAAKLDCRCKPFTRLAHLPETSRKALDYSMTVRDADTSYWWSMNEAVRDAFMAGVQYNDRERAIRQSANEVPAAGATDAEKMKNLQTRLDAINTRIQNQRQPKDQ